MGADFGEAVGVADGEGKQVMFGGDAGYLRAADVPVVVVVGDFDAVHAVLNDDVGRVIAGVAVVAEQAAAGQIEFHAVVFVKGAAGGAHIDFPAGDDEDAVGEMFRRDAVQGQAPVLPPVVGDGDAVQPGGFNSGDYGFGDFGGGRLETEHFADVGMQVQAYSGGSHNGATGLRVNCRGTREGAFPRKPATLRRGRRRCAG